MMLPGSPMQPRSSLHRACSPTTAHELDALRRRVWREQGVVSIGIDDITDPWLRHVRLRLKPLPFAQSHTEFLACDRQHRRVDIGAADAYPPGWVHLPQAIEAEWVKQLVAEQLRTVKDRRGFARQEWAKLRERNEALDCAVLARAALWLLGADRYGERFWQQAHGQIADAPLVTSEIPTVGNIAPPPPASETATPVTTRPSTWLAPRGGWLR
jgi:hypothetical protein